MKDRHEKCASCRQFMIDAVAPNGRALCDIRNELYRFNSRACVIYDRASDINRRAPIVKQLMEKAEP